SNPDYAPTPEEAAAIALEIESLQFPHSVSARDLDDLWPLLPSVDRDSVFPFADARGEFIVFVQQRIETEDGKAYLPWTCWDDGQWRCMEPDGLLPLYGLDRLAARRGCAILVCEGPKTARAVQRLLVNGKDHPWVENLRQYVPIGWPGGTERWSAVDWG